ncbi:sugar transporter [Pseudomonas sp. S 311-6]|uniref:Major facilitator superfamily (MFS) profile domain-containing protein n=1 Tax=Kerstersia gyiorum TaxID=206506 RepID=A0A171KT87_9BURK|nr:sugar transporter [Kerstersia gyiorum]KKO72104.1 hypothetical protein AAV32_07065 [Kerstersia gyiorum]MCO7639596.1 sugar transporter [Pseudomonas sp. S 311-6]
METTSPPTPGWRDWLPVVSLALAAFIFNTTEFVPIGLLPDIARSFDMDVAHTGLLLTGYAWTVAILSLPLTLLTAAQERRRLLLVLFAIFIASHILAGFAWSFSSLMAARIGIACSHAIFWSISIPLAVRLAPEGKQAKGLGLIVTGSSLATVLGVPLGTLLGHQTGWRITFMCIAGISLLVMLALRRLLPPLPSTNPAPLKNLPTVLKRPALLQAYLLTLIIVTGHFTAYTYFTPFMTRVGGFSENFVVSMLLVIGGAGILGTLIFTRHAPRHPFEAFAGPLAVLLLCLLALNFAAATAVTTTLLCMVWGASMTIVYLGLQSKVLASAPDSADVATSIYSGIFNIGIGGGALMGSTVLLHYDINSLGTVGGLFIAFALTMTIFVWRRYWQTKPA